MKKLTAEEIAELASRKGVERVAVENFLSTVDSNDGIDMALSNLKVDAALYKWNINTIFAIADGIFLAGSALNERRNRGKDK